MTLPAWDAYDAYLFDIDGTLLNSVDAVHYFAFCDALTRIAGRPVNLDGVMTHGNVDPAILRDAWTIAGVPEDTWRPRLDEARAFMCEQFTRNQHDLRIEVLDGAPEVLAHLRQQGATLAVATGNLAGIGELKLTRCDLRRHFHVGGYSDGHESRTAVFAAAAAQVRALTSPAARICVFGDTPADILAAQALEFDVIAVATGIFSFEQLAALHPTRTLHRLTELLESPVVDASTSPASPTPHALP